MDLTGDFTVEAYIRTQRQVKRWRGRRFVVRDGFHHFALVREGPKVTRYKDGSITKNKIPLEYVFRGEVNEFRLSSIAREPVHLLGAKSE